MLVASGGFIASTSSNAQIGQSLGSTSGSYCKFKKKDKIEVDTWLPLGFSPEFARNMTLRRLAEMAQSKGYPSFVTEEGNCGILLINQNPTNRRCKLTARMENASESVGQLESGEERLNVAEVMSLTDSDAPRYPRRVGILNYKNQCVIK